MTKKPRGLKVFRRDDAKDLADTTVMSRPVMEPMPDREVLREVATTSGYLNKVLFGDPESGGMSLIPESTGRWAQLAELARQHRAEWAAQTAEAH
jgi:hypothetical protein